MYGPENSGLGRYVEQLSNHLLNIDSDNEYILFCLKNNIPKLEIANYKLKIVICNIPLYSWQEQILYSSIIKKESVDLMHFPHWNVPVFYNQPFIVTVHDVIMYHYSRAEASTHGPFVYWLKDKLHRLVIKRAVSKAKHIITPSKFTKQDVAKTFGVDLKKISVTHLAPFAIKNKEQEIGITDTATTNSTLPNPYVLYVGNAYPHKNLDKLLEAWKIFSQKYSDKYQMILVGKKNYFYQKLIEKITMCQCNNVIFIDYLNDKELVKIYQKANLYVFPSLYEGFGLPSLEAMQYNIPVISSKASCLPEILEDAAFYFDPNNLDEMAYAMHLCLNDMNLRNKLTTRARALLKKYSWVKTAKQTLKIYRDVL